MKARRSHDEATIARLRSDDEFAGVHLQAALEQLDEEGGEVALLTALRHIVEARGGFADIAARAGLSRESLYRALSANGNPTLRTLASVLRATGLKLSAA